MKFDLKVTGIAEVKRSMHKYSVEVNKKLQKEVARTATNIHRDARQAVAVDTGVARTKIQMTVGNLAAVVWSGIKYSLDIEQGQKPGTWPNPFLLQGWVKRKLNISKSKLKGVTFLIGRKIFEKGTDAQPYFEPAVIKHKQKFFNRVRRIILNGKDKF